MNFAQKLRNLLISKITRQQPRGIKLVKCSFFGILGGENGLNGLLNEGEVTFVCMCDCWFSLEHGHRPCSGQCIVQASVLLLFYVSIFLLKSS